MICPSCKSRLIPPAYAAQYAVDAAEKKQMIAFPAQCCGATIAIVPNDDGKIKLIINNDMPEGVWFDRPIGWENVI